MLMFEKHLYTRLPYCLRRRFARQNTVKIIAMMAGIIALLFIILQTWMMYGLGSSKSKDTITNVRRQSPPPGGKKPVGAAIFGVKSNERGYYHPNSNNNFICLTSGEEIPFDQVNDDYCDCSDGSDEPSTGACKNTVFTCLVVSKFSGQMEEQTLPSSRINDGVCDCCDGRDEWRHLNNDEVTLLDLDIQEKLGRFQAPCDNVC